MKRFDTEAEKTRLIENARMHEDWALMLSDGTIGNLFDVIAESNNEKSRYMEFLYGEKKWKTARLMTSLQADGDLIGYKRQLPESAIGYVIVSTSDAEGNNRLENYGSYFFDLDAASDYDEIEKETTDSIEKTKALVPWTCSTPYSVPAGTRFISNSGIEYISTKTVFSRVLSTPWKQWNSSNEKLTTFYSFGGWSGLKYLKIPVIQGKKKTTSIGRTDGNTRFQTFTLAATNVEAANNSISKDFFKIRLVKGTEEETWVEIDNILKAGPYDKVFEKSILKDETGIKIKFGDGLTGKIPGDGMTIFVDYLETLGKKGNLDSKYQINTMVLPNDEVQVDPRTNSVSTFMFCTNDAAIQGGKNIESKKDFKKNAPVSYLNSYTIGNAAQYLSMFMKHSPLNLLHCKIYKNKDIESSQINYFKQNSTDTVLNEYTTIAENYNVTAILANGTAVSEENAQSEFIDPLLLSLQNEISPGDTFNYVEPNMIQTAVGVKVKTSDTTLNKDDAKSLISLSLLNEYSVYNQEFNEPFYNSKLVELASIFNWADSVSVITEAMAKVSFESTDLQILQLDASTDSLDNFLLAIPFTFDKVFSQNKYKNGFKNCTANADYLLKVDLNFINGGDSTKDRTFFLFDNRVDESGATDLQSGQSLKLDDESTAITEKTILISSLSSTNKIIFYKENDNSYKNRQVRVAQFGFINDITDNEFMAKAKSFVTQPIENRPYEQDSTGENRVFTSTMVSESLQAPLSGNESDSIGESCFKKNENFIDNVSILFNENYDDIDADYTGDGYLILPLSYFDFDTNTLQASEFESNPTNFMKTLEILMKEYVSVKVYAQPKQDEFEPENPNDIIYVDEDDIKVETTVKY